MYLLKTVILFKSYQTFVVIDNARILIRSYITATDWAPSIWGVEEFIETRPDVTVVVLLQVTSPLLKAKHLNLALKKLHFPKAFDCIFSVTRYILKIGMIAFIFKSSNS